MPTVNIGPWPQGIDNISEPSNLAKGACLDAVNGVIRRGGHFQRRFSETQLNSTPTDSLWKSPDGPSYAAVDGVLSRLSWSGGLVATALYALPTYDPLSYTTVNDTVIFASMAVLGSIVGDVVTPLGVELPGAFSAAPAAAGGLDEGRYGVAISYVAGNEEGGLSDVQFVDVAAGGGLQFSLPTPIEPRVTMIRLYRTPCNGDQLYRALDVPLLPSALVGTDTLTTMAATQYKERMLGGSYIREWRGRLVVARGHVLLFSEPMNYGLRDARHGFVQMPERITWFEAMDTGMYVGTTKKVYWLSGTTPKDLSVKTVELNPPVGGASILMSVADTGLDVKYENCAVWLGANGYSFGMPSGDVVRPVSSIFRINTLDMTGKLALVDGVLTTVLQ